MKKQVVEVREYGRKAGSLPTLVAALIVAVLFPATSASAGIDHPVAIRDWTFIPRVVEASAGDTITWTNSEVYPTTHDLVTYAGDASITTGGFVGGQSVTRVFSGGTAYYRCRIHSSLTKAYGGYDERHSVCNGMCGEITDKKTPPSKPVLLTPSTGVLALVSWAEGPGTGYEPIARFTASGTAEPWTLVTVDGLTGQGLADADGTWYFESYARPGSYEWSARAAHPNGLESERSDEVKEVFVSEPIADRVVTFSSADQPGSPVQAPTTLDPQYLKPSPGETILFKRSDPFSWFTVGQVGGDAYLMPSYSSLLGYYKVTVPAGTGSYEVCTPADEYGGGATCVYGGVTDRAGPVSPITISTPQPGSMQAVKANPSWYPFSGTAEPGTRIVLTEGAIDVTRSEGLYNSESVFADASGNWTAWADLDGIGTKTVTATSTRPMDGESDSTSVTFRIVDVPGRVGSVSARTGSGTGQIAVSWDPVPGDDSVTGYRVYGRESTVSPKVLVAEVGPATSSVVHSGLRHGKKMYYTVLAFNVAGESKADPVEVQGSAPPFTPASVKASPGPQAGQVSVSWNPPSIGASEVLSYRVYSRNAGGVLALAAELPPSARSHVTDGVPTGEYRYYKVSAVSATGEGVLSAEVNAKPPVPPAEPRDLSATSTAALGKVRLSWSAPSTNGGSPITGYRVYRGTSTSDKSFLYQVGVVSSYIDSTCPFLTICYYHVTALNALGEGVASNEASAIPLRTS